MSDDVPLARILLVGGTGFAGGHIMRALVKRGHAVTLTSRFDGGGQADRQTGPGHQVVRWSGGIEELADTIRAADVSVVAVLAAHFVAEHEPCDVAPLVDANIKLPSLVMEAARQTQVRRFVTSGTFWEERTAKEPEAVNLYAATRRAAKELLRYYAIANGWSATHLRVSDLYGPADPRHKLFFHLRTAVRTGIPLAMSPGGQLLDLVYVEDAAAAFAIAIEAAIRDESQSLHEYGIFTGQPMRLREIVTTYELVVGRPVPVVWAGRDYRSREVMEPRFLPGPPGWTPVTDLMSGLRAMERGPGGLLT